MANREAWSIAIRVFDLWAHEQDMRRALNQPGGLDGVAAAHSRERMLMGAGYELQGRIAPAAGTAVPQLKAISSRLSRQGASLIIEATEPAAYVATQPDPLTVYVDFRNVGAEGVANRFAASAKSPIVGVAIEAVESLGAPVSRVRITLAQPVAHRVAVARVRGRLQLSPRILDVHLAERRQPWIGLESRWRQQSGNENRDNQSRQGDADEAKGHDSSLPRHGCGVVAPWQ